MRISVFGEEAISIFLDNSLKECLMVTSWLEFAMCSATVLVQPYRGTPNRQDLEEFL
jgi:hypothetical protein